jgi:hypothetical protein
VAPAARGLEIVPPQIDGTPAHPNANRKLNFAATLAFATFRLDTSPTSTEIAESRRSAPQPRPGLARRLFEFSGKQRPICTVLALWHTSVAPDFLGQT